MLTIYLMAYVCTTAARDDCAWQYMDHMTGNAASIRCELEKEAWLDGRRGFPPIRGSSTVTLDCQSGEEQPLVVTESDGR